MTHHLRQRMHITTTSRHKWSCVRIVLWLCSVVRKRRNHSKNPTRSRIYWICYWLMYKLLKYAILSELLRKCYTRLPSQMATLIVVVDSQDNSTPEVWCYCCKGECGEMIKWYCEINWFHIDCLTVWMPEKGYYWSQKKKGHVTHTCS